MNVFLELKRRHIYRVAAAYAVVAVWGLIAASVGEAKVLAQWVQLGADGGASVRAVTDGTCPQIMFDGVATPMAVRARPDANFGNVKPAAFPVTGCEAEIPRGAIAGMLDGKALPLPRPDPRRIVVLGDTGCRLLKGVSAQECNNPKAWPFPDVAKAAAASHPDLVIHVGDYMYREDACPADVPGCAQSPYGYGWEPWYADFFEPASPLFAAAPWVLVRGNHEDCDRAGEGWLRFLDHDAMENNCKDFSGIFVARLGAFGVVVVDGAKAADPKEGAAQMGDLLRQQFKNIKSKIPAEAWLTAHRPLDAMGEDRGVNKVDNSIQELALGAEMPMSVRLFVSGHIHFFQAVDFGGVRPPQLVVGTGGDTLAPLPPMSLAGSRINGRTVTKASAYSGFAYMVWDRNGTSWLGTLFDVNGKALDQCRLIGRSLTCNH